MDIEKVKVLIAGSGPAGYTAAIYCSRANLSPVLYEGLQPGGQLTITTDIENFPGYPDGVSGPVMMEQLKAQALRFGTSVRSGIVTNADLSQHPFKITVDTGKTIETDALIIATGATAKYLGLPDEVKYAGGGVSACATCDGFFYRGKDVAVVGGGDTAAEEALYLSGLCRKVYLIVRRNELRASKVMQQRVQTAASIEVLWEHQVKSLWGEGVVEGAVLWKKKGTPAEEEVRINIDGLFLAIGHKPNSELVAGVVDTDDVGYIKTVPGSSRTNVPGVFACGDVQDPVYRQAVTSAGSGCMAAIDAERWLAEL
ncbi:MAG: thioredoxin-disulfide reductase [Cytophagaceae bacterium]|jgi:thioredoxin reductase (NADPH)|nr:thioredoxin-disulfide reductase [Cytophagaceae bacterium]